jgi:hypothetical protein
MNGFDRRNQARVSMTATGTIYGRQARLPCSALDVCIRGMALVTLERRDAGDFLRILWSLGECDSVGMEAVVVHATPRDCGTWLLGVRFVRMSDDARRAIFSHIRNRALGLRARVLGTDESHELSGIAKRATSGMFAAVRIAGSAYPASLASAKTSRTTSSGR